MDSVWHESSLSFPMRDWFLAKINRPACFVSQAVSDRKICHGSPQPLLSKPTGAVWDYMCGCPPPAPPHHHHHHHHSTLHHTGLAVEGRSRNRFSERCYRAQTRHGRCWTSLKSSWWCSVDSLGSERKDQFKKKRGEFGKWQFCWTQIEKHMLHTFLRQWLAWRHTSVIRKSVMGWDRVGLEWSVWGRYGLSALCLRADYLALKRKLLVDCWPVCL